ncbi:MAG: hypothetical protein ACI9UJ_000001, partial [bacterium]
MRLTLLLFLLVLSQWSFAQHANHWIFGKNVHIEFNDDTILQHRSIASYSQIEGTAAYSDSLGKLV